MWCECSIEDWATALTKDAGVEAEHLAVSTYDNVDQLLLVLDQLALSRELLFANDPARARMALILLDNLADVLIYRHNRELIGGAQDRYARRRFNRKQRAALQNSFEERLGLAQESPAFSWLSGGPLVDQMTSACYGWSTSIATAPITVILTSQHLWVCSAEFCLRPSAGCRWEATGQGPDSAARRSHSQNRWNV